METHALSPQQRADALHALCNLLSQPGLSGMGHEAALPEALWVQQQLLLAAGPGGQHIKEFE